MAKGIKRTIKKSKESNVVYLFEAFDEFMTEKQAKNLSNSTIRNYEQSFSFFAKFHEFDKHTPADTITASHFYEWMNSLRLDGVQPTSINHYLRDVRAFVYWCMDADRAYIPAFKINEMRKQEEPIKLYTDEELALLLEKPLRSSDFGEWRTWAIVNWVLATGNRASTICAVRVGDIDFNRGEITLRHTKNKKAQIIPLSSSLETVLKEYGKLFRREANDEAFLFCNVGEYELTTNALRLSFSRYAKSRGVDKTNIHGLRHNFAKGWIKNGGNMFTLQKILGHSSLEMTRRYVKLFSEDIKEDFDRFSPLDTIKKSQRRTKEVRKFD